MTLGNGVGCPLGRVGPGGTDAQILALAPSLWWSARRLDTVYNDNDVIATPIPDYSNNSRGGTPTNSPVFRKNAINGVSAFQFTAASNNYFRSPAYAQPGTCSTIIVSVPTAANAAFARYYEAGSNNQHTLAHGGGGVGTSNDYIIQMGSNFATTFTSALVGFPKVIEIHSGAFAGSFPGQYQQVYVNGTLLIENVANGMTAGNTTVSIGQNGNSAGGSLNGYVSEVIQFPRRLTKPEETQLRGLMKSIFGLW